MRNIILIIALSFLNMSAWGNSRITSNPNEAISNSSGICKVEYYPRYIEDDAVTQIWVFCGQMAGLIWDADGTDHQITLKWIDEDNLKVTHPPDLIINEQLTKLNVRHEASDNKDAYYSELKIEFDPPYDEERFRETVYDETNWPTDCDEAAQIIFSGINDKSLKTLKKTEKSDLIRYHMGWGTGIRNSLGLWRGNDQLINSCMLKEPNSQKHPDTVSMILIELVWSLVQTRFWPSPE